MDTGAPSFNYPDAGRRCAVRAQAVEPGWCLAGPVLSPGDHQRGNERKKDARREPGKDPDRIDRQGGAAPETGGLRHRV